MYDIYIIRKNIGPVMTNDSIHITLSVLIFGDTLTP